MENEFFLKNSRDHMTGVKYNNPTKFSVLCLGSGLGFLNVCVCMHVRGGEITNHPGLRRLNCIRRQWDRKRTHAHKHRLDSLTHTLELVSLSLHTQLN